MEGCSLAYSLEASIHARHVAAEFDGHRIWVILPEDVMRSWTEGNDIRIDARSNSGPDVLVEKDFQCLHKRAEENPGAYPHPLASATN
jgi:hypothetical protein